MITILVRLGLDRLGTLTGSIIVKIGVSLLTWIWLAQPDLPVPERQRNYHEYDSKRVSWF